ncbi:MAG: methyltransferase domain-containing protein [Saprospiraceae bacterium]
MHIPRWKKWLSHLTPLTLEATGSDMNPELTVALSKGRVQLLAGEAIYSWDDLYHNFDMAFAELKLEERQFENVLLLGLGLGSIPVLLEQKYGRDYRYTAVEWDETVAELALRYTLGRLKSPVDVVTADAEVFVAVCQDSFDLLIVDIFEEDLTPPQFETPEFLEACDELLRPGGLLLFNRLHGEAKDKVAAERFFERTFKKVFPQAWVIDTQGNWILCTQKSVTDLPV